MLRLVKNEGYDDYIKYPYYSKEDLEKRALEILCEYNYELLKIPQPIPIENIIENHYNLILDYQNLSLDGNILGLTTFETGYIKVYDKNAQKAYPLEVRSGTILIDNSIAEDQKQNGRFRFTCAHEVSHWDLHKNIYFNRNAYREEINAVKCLKRDVEKSFSNNKKKTPKEWLEWQADFLGASILMPLPTVKEYYKIQYENIVSKIKKDDADYPFAINAVIKAVADFFDVSERAMSIRLKSLGLI